MSGGACRPPGTSCAGRSMPTRARHASCSPDPQLLPRPQPIPAPDASSPSACARCHSPSAASRRQPFACRTSSAAPDPCWLEPRPSTSPPTPRRSRWRFPQHAATRRAALSIPARRLPRSDRRTRRARSRLRVRNPATVRLAPRLRRGDGHHDTLEPSATPPPGGHDKPAQDDDDRLHRAC